MQRIDRALCVSAGILGLVVFVVCLQTFVRTEQDIWIVVGAVGLIAGLTAASFVAWRGHKV